MATCGKCHATNVDVQHVKECYAIGPKDKAGPFGTKMHEAMEHIVGSDDPSTCPHGLHRDNCGTCHVEEQGFTAGDPFSHYEHRDDFAREVSTGQKSSSELASRSPGFRVGKPQAEVANRGPIQEEDRVYLFVPFEEKDDAKSKFGAKWDAAKRQWFVKKSADFDEMPKHWFDEPETYVAEDGIYKVANEDGTFDIFKVATAQYHDATGYKFARKLTLVDRKESEMVKGHPEHTKKGKFIKAKGMQFRLKPEQMLPADEALKFGQVYGFCVRCGAILTNEESIQQGMGDW